MISDLEDLPVPVILQNWLSVVSVPVIWQNRVYTMEECASDLAELPVPVIWQNCLSVDSVPAIWHNTCMWRSVPVISDLAD